MRKLLLTTTALLCIATPALANLIAGTITVRPLATIDNLDTITFTPPVGSQVYAPAFQSGDFLTFGPDSTFAMFPTGVPIFGPDFLGHVASGLSADGLSSWSFDALAQSSILFTPTEFSITGYGNLFMTGFEPTLTSFWLDWTHATTDLHFPPPPFSAEFSLQSLSVPATVPGPVVGAGIPGLIAALAWLVGLSWRRRRA